MKNYARIAFAALLAYGLLFLGGCPKEEEEEDTVAPGLVGNWSNRKAEDELKTFAINADGSFTAKLNPYPSSEGGGFGTVTGLLIREGSDYKMNNMRETTGISWGSAVGIYNGRYVQIVLSANDTVFTLSSADSTVHRFFGGTYFK